MEITAYRSRRKLTVFLAWCLLLMLAWGLWIWQLDASDLTHDEAISPWLGSRSLGAILTHLTSAAQEHPPVYYLLIHWWIGLAGPSEFSLRLFSVWAGVVGLALTGWVARLALGSKARFAALLPAFLLALTPGLVYYARVARMYTVLVALALLSTGLFTKHWLGTRDRPQRMGLVGLVVVHSLAVLTHYYMVLPILIQPLVLLALRRWKQFLVWCAIHLVPASLVILWLAASPGLQMSARGASLSLAFLTRFRLLSLLGKLLFSPVVRVQFRLLSVILALIGLGAVLAIWKRRAFGVWLGLSLVVPFVLIRAMPLNPAPRYVFFVMPSAALALGFLCAAPVCFLPARRPWLNRGASLVLSLVAAGLLIQGGLSRAITFERSRYGRVLETVKAHARPGDAILFYGPWQQIQLQYYDPGGLPPIVALPERAPPRLRPDEAEPVLRELMARYDRLWVLPAAVSDVDPEYYVGSWLRENAHNVWDTGGLGLYLPALAPASGADGQPLTFGDALELQEVWHDPQPVPAGEGLRVTLSWNPLRTIEQHVQVTLSLIDQNGHTWAMARSVPGHWADAAETWAPGQAVTDREGLIVPQGTPPGAYTLRLMASDYDTGAPLAVDGRKEVDLLTVRVTDPVHPPVQYDLPSHQGATFCSPDGGRCVALDGYSPGGYRFQQGYPVPFTLHWLSEQAPVPDIQLRLSVVHDPWLPWEQSTPIVTVTLPSPWSYAAQPPFCQPATLSQAPSSAAGTSLGPHRVALPLVLNGDGCVQPEPDRVVTLPAAIAIPPDATTGAAQLALEVIGPDGQVWPTAGGNESLPLFKLDIEGRPVERSLPKDLTPIQVDFGDAMALRGYRVEGDARPGGQLRATYAWYARKRPTEIYAVFNHLVASDGTMVAQIDGWPLEGRLLTIQWEPGEYVEDTHALQIPTDAPPGPYTLYVGLYNAANGNRQPATQDGQPVPDGRVLIPLPHGSGR